MAKERRWGRRDQPQRPSGTFGQPRGRLVASAAELSARSRRSNVDHQAWQSQGWLFYDTVPELEFFVTWKSSATSRCKLVALWKDDEGNQVAQPNSPAQEILDGIGAGEGPSQTLARMSQHLSVPGDSYLVGKDVIGGGMIWDAYSPDELKTNGSQWILDIRDGNPSELPEESLVIRVWRPHPRFRWQSTSSVRSALPVLAELNGYNLHTMATIDSRLASAGLIAVPQEVSFATLDENNNAEDTNFVELFMKVAQQAIKDRASAAALIPIIAKMPADAIDKIKFFDFWSKFDGAIVQLIDNALRRLALGLDIPPEMLLGVGDTSHWNGYLITEQAVKVHIEPDLELMCGAFTTELIRPALSLMGAKDTNRWTVGYDASNLLLQQSDEANALAAYEHMAVSPTGLRSLLKIPESMAPKDEDLARMIIMAAAMRGNLADVLTLLKLPVPADLAKVMAATVKPDGQTETLPTVGPSLVQEQQQIDKAENIKVNSPPSMGVPGGAGPVPNGRPAQPGPKQVTGV